jgi:2'-5' RNA ligase
VKPEGETRYRLFFALWPDPAIQKAMSQPLRALGHIRGRPVPKRNYHITLAFLGNVETEQLSCLCERAAGVACPPVSLNFDTLGQFRRSGILWLGCSETPASLLQLYHDLGQALIPCGFQPESRRFQSHVTLYRRFQGRLPDVAIRPVRWEVEGFHLVLSESIDDGVRYQSIATFPRLGQ